MSHLVLCNSSVIFSICIDYVLLIELIFEAFYSESLWVVCEFILHLNVPPPGSLSFFWLAWAARWTGLLPMIVVGPLTSVPVETNTISDVCWWKMFGLIQPVLVRSLTLRSESLTEDNWCSSLNSLGSCSAHSLEDKQEETAVSVSFGWTGSEPVTEKTASSLINIEIFQQFSEWKCYQSVCERRVQSDGGAGWADGQPRPDGGGGDGAGGSQRRCRGGRGHRHQRLLAAEERLTQGGEAFLWSNTTGQASTACLNSERNNSSAERQSVFSLLSNL